MRAGLSTVCAGAVERDPDRVLDLMLRSGAAGVELDATLPEGLLDELVRRLSGRRDELAVWAVENVCPIAKVSAAELASLDREESRAAVQAAGRTIRRAADVGAEFVGLRLGAVTRLRSAWPEARRAFLRGELDEETVARRLRERSAFGQAHLDPARRALDTLARLADAAGIRLALRNPARYVELPSAIELRMLMEDLSGAPLVPLWDIPAAHLLGCFGVPFEDTAAAWRSAPLVHLADACGPVGGLGVGRGEVDLAAVVKQLAEGARVVFPPSSGLDEREIVDAMASLRALPA